MKLITSLILGMCLLVTLPAHALDLDTAKQQKLVGETDGGYLAAVGNATDAVAKLINDINGKRKQHYQQLASKNNVALPEIEKLAGKTGIAKTAAGLMIRINGNWSAKN